jgi:glucuronokinase
MTTTTTIAIILAAATETKLEQEILRSDDPEIYKLRGLPKALCPIGGTGTSILEHWYNIIQRNRDIRQIFVVSSAAKYKHFERWATSNGIPTEYVVNDGVTRNDDRIGSARDLQLGLRRAKQVVGVKDMNVMVIAGDSIFYKTFDVKGVTSFFNVKKSSSILLYHTLGNDTPVEDRGMVLVNENTKEIKLFMEKPTEEEWDDAKAKYLGDGALNANLASPMFYLFKHTDLHLIDKFIKEYGSDSNAPLGCGKLVAYMQKKTKFFGMRLPSAFALIGTKAGLEEYKILDRSFSSDSLNGNALRNAHGVVIEDIKKVVKKSYARVGLMGNPSDGYFGKTLGLSVKNFWATVTLEASKTLRLIPNPLYDPNEFGSLNGLHEIGRREGYQGGMRLLMATCKKFVEFCTLNGISLPNRNFTVSYDTNIPRQVGLAGSSAIVSALFKALMTFYGLNNHDIPIEKQPSFVLSVEMEELSINAGLQDRVVQIYEGLIFMDFNKEYMDEHGHGIYKRLTSSNVADLPLFLAYENDPSDSGKIHSTVRQQWNDGVQSVRKAMGDFAHYTDKAVTAMEKKDAGKLMALMNANFSLRRELFGDPCLGEANLKMIEIGRRNGAAVKFPGSGGAVVGLCKKENISKLREAYEKERFIFVELAPYFPPNSVDEAIVNGGVSSETFNEQLSVNEL